MTIRDDNGHKVTLPNTTYVYIRDLVFAALIGGLILKGIKNGEKIAAIDVHLTSHIFWGEWVATKGLEDVEALELRIKDLEKEK